MLKIILFTINIANQLCFNKIIKIFLCNHPHLDKIAFKINLKMIKIKFNFLILVEIKDN